MTREDVVAFATRDWAGMAASKADYWASRKATMTPVEALSLGADLRQHALALRPDWPSREDRAADTAVHRRVSEALRAVATIR